MPAKRAYGMDQDFYPWSAIVSRPALRWPDGARVALAVIVNLEHWDWELPEGTPLPMPSLASSACLMKTGLSARGSRMPKTTARPRIWFSRVTRTMAGDTRMGSNASEEDVG